MFLQKYPENASGFNKESIFQTIKKQNKDILFFQLIQSHKMTALLEMFYTY